MDIKIYGTRTSGSQFVKNLIKHYLNLAEIDYNLEEIDDVKQFMTQEITSIPAVQINDDTPIEVKSNGSFNNSIRNIICEILKRNKFGSIPRTLVPLDFSDESINAFNFANKLSQTHGQLLVLAHIYYPTSVDINGTVFFDANIRGEKERMLKEFVDGINQDWIGDIMKASLVTGKFGEGFPVPKLLEMAREENAEYIVIGSTGAGNSFKNIFGSVSTELMYKADRPVFIIPPKAHYKSFNHILFAASSEAEDAKCIDFISDFAKKNNSIIHIVHVRESFDDFEKDIAYEKLWYENYPKGQLIFDNILGNDISQTINEYAAENNIDLMIVHPQKRSFFKRIFHKSVSKKLAITCSIPLLAVHTDD